uniref:Uncharacterized protein n=1 Tax=Arundo donax TaxID=35708 RepID=A0A0A9DV43_ARUDO
MHSSHQAVLKVWPQSFPPSVSHIHELLRLCSQFGANRTQQAIFYFLLVRNLHDDQGGKLYHKQHGASGFQLQQIH